MGLGTQAAEAISRKMSWQPTLLLRMNTPHARPLQVLCMEDPSATSPGTVVEVLPLVSWFPALASFGGPCESIRVTSGTRESEGWESIRRGKVTACPVCSLSHGTDRVTYMEDKWPSLGSRGDVMGPGPTLRSHYTPKGNGGCQWLPRDAASCPSPCPLVGTMTA